MGLGTGPWWGKPSRPSPLSQSWYTPSGIILFMLLTRQLHLIYFNDIQIFTVQCIIKIMTIFIGTRFFRFYYVGTTYMECRICILTCFIPPIPVRYSCYIFIFNNHLDVGSRNKEFFSVFYEVQYYLFYLI